MKNLWIALIACSVLVGAPVVIIGLSNQSGSTSVSTTPKVAPTRAEVQPQPETVPVIAKPESSRPSYSYGSGVSVPVCWYGSSGRCLMEGSPELALWMEQQKWDPAPQAPSYGTTYSNPADCDADPVPWIVILSSGYNLSWTAMCAQELDATVSSYIAGWTDDYGQPVFIVDYFRV